MIFAFLIFFTSVALATETSSPPGACAALITQAVPPSWAMNALEGIEGASSHDVKAARFRLQRDGFRAATLNAELIAAHTPTYTHEVPCGTITNQKASGTCWDFASLNWIRAQLVREGKIPADFEFSQSYIYFYSLFEKSNEYLEKVIIKQTTTNDAGITELQILAPVEIGKLNPNIGDGGRMELFLFLVTKYGLVPQSAMAPTASFENTAHLRADLEVLLAAHAFQIIHFTAEYKNALITDWNESDFRLRLFEHKATALKAILKLLISHLGTPPSLNQVFEVPEWNGNLKTYTPLSFAREAAAFHADDYVKIASFTDVAEGKGVIVPHSGVSKFESNPENQFPTRYLNLSIDRVLELMVISLRAGLAIPTSVDITDDVDIETGILHPHIFSRKGIYALTAEERGRTITRARLRQIELSTSNHMVMTVGFDQDLSVSKSGNDNDPNSIRKFKIDNSWGRKKGTDGYFHAYTQWLRRNLFSIVIRKEILSPAEREAWDRTFTGRKPNRIAAPLVK